jgi:hypothetical protein
MYREIMGLVQLLVFHVALMPRSSFSSRCSTGSSAIAVWLFLSIEHFGLPGNIATLRSGSLVFTSFILNPRRYMIISVR